MKCFGCSNEGKARDISGTTYYICDDCFKMHVDRNEDAISKGRQDLEAANYKREVMTDMDSNGARNKAYAQQVLNNQVNIALGTAAAYEKAGMQKQAEEMFNVALEYDEALNRLSMIPADVCIPDVPGFQRPELRY